MKIPRDIQVMKVACETCPFEGAHPNLLEQDVLLEYTLKIVNLESQHLCHTVDNKKVCRGGRNIMLRVMCAKGLLTQPTDECFDETRAKYLPKE
jgi:hypothetical protein